MAILKMSSRNIDTAVITNVKGNVCAVLSTNIIYPLWYECNDTEKEKAKQRLSSNVDKDKPVHNLLSIQNITNMNETNEKKKKGERKINETLSLIEDLQREYEGGVYGGFHHDSLSTEFLSILDRPLRYCESLGGLYMYAYMNVYTYLDIYVWMYWIDR
jgi:hypothetical protein